MLRHLDFNFRKINLGKQVTTLLLLLFVLEAVISGVTLFKVMSYSAKAANISKALALIDTLGSVRDYTVRGIMPALIKDGIPPPLTDNLPAKVYLQNFSAEAARKIFRHLKSSQEQYKRFIYREAMLQPTKNEQLADDFETKEIVERFRLNPACKELNNIDCKYLTGYSLDNKYLYVARPLSIMSNKIVEKIVGARIIYVPVDLMNQNAIQWMSWPLVIVLVVSAGTIYLVNLWLKKYVVLPLNRMTRVAEAVSKGDMDAEFERSSNDEVGRLSEAFTRMKTSLAIAMQSLEKS